MAGGRDRRGEGSLLGEGQPGAQGRSGNLATLTCPKLIPLYVAFVTTPMMLISAVKGFPSVMVASATPLVPTSSGKERSACVTRFC